MVQNHFKCYAKVHSINGQKILALCDEELLGKTIHGKEMDLRVNRDFYEGQLMNSNKILTLLRDVHCVNVIGKNCIKELKNNKIIDNKNIFLIGKIPHAQIYYL